LTGAGCSRSRKAGRSTTRVDHDPPKNCAMHCTVTVLGSRYADAGGSGPYPVPAIERGEPMSHMPAGYPPLAYCCSCGRDFSGDRIFERHKPGLHEYTFLEGLLERTRPSRTAAAASTLRR